MSDGASGSDDRPARNAPARPAKQPATTSPSASDVYLDVPEVKVEEIDLEVENLRARVSLQAEVLDLVRLNVGADVELGRVKLTIKGVEAQALLKVRLDNVAHIIDRVMNTIDDNPQILENLTRGIGTAVRDLGTGAGHAVQEVGAGAGHAVQDVGAGAGHGLRDVGASAGHAVQDVGAGAGHGLRDVGTTAGHAVREVSAGAEGAVQEAGAGAEGAVQEAGAGAGDVVRDVGKKTTEAVRDEPGHAAEPHQPGEPQDADKPGEPTRSDRADKADKADKVGTPRTGRPAAGEGHHERRAGEQRASELATALARASVRAGRRWIWHVTGTGGDAVRRRRKKR
jgi:hypothetical protein